jgi:RHS repeat-associated protein
MDLEHQGRDRSGRLYSLSRVALWASPAVIAAALLINALPNPAHSQINGRVTAAPQVSAASPAAKPKLPQAPVQVELPAPPPTKLMAGLEEVLVATGPVSAQENTDLDAALMAFHDAPAKAGANADFDDYAQPLLGFISAHPQSNWNAALQLNLGLGYYHAGYWSRAFAAYEKAWALGRSAETPEARLMVDRAVGELAKMHARVGHAKELDALLKDIGTRPIGGPATELIQGAREGLWTFRRRPEISYLCGPNALKNVLITLKAGPEQIKVAEDARSGSHGFTLTQVAALADKAGLKYTLIARKPGQPVPVPSVIHWKVHHYAAITGMQNGLYHVEDPTFGDAGIRLLTQRAIDAEASGYFLVPRKTANAAKEWRAVRADSPESGAVYGMGNATGSETGVVMSRDRKMRKTCESATSTAPQVCTFASPMTTVNAHTMEVSLNLNDTPVGYAPQKGVSARTMLTYNQREDMQPATFGFSNLSPKWNHNWMAFIVDNPNPAFAGSSVSRYSSGGGGYVYLGYTASTGAFTPEVPDNSHLFRIPPSGAATSYERDMPDGSKEIYAKFDGATAYPRRVFLTSVVDPQGNTTTLNYDSTLRLTSLTDAMGRSTTFTYGLPAHPLLITQVTDPFGRSSQMTYDSSSRLASITDPIGITSSFTYSTTEPTFITMLTTPYGTSTFSDTPNPNDTVEPDTRSLTMTDPLGFSDFLYFYQNPSITPATDPAATIPSGMVADNGLLEWRNTYYWDRHAFAQGVTVSGGTVISEDFTKAFLMHWQHVTGTTVTSRTLGTVKPPLERRTWFNYINQAIHGANSDGNIYDRPILIGRVLDDGTTQKAAIGYNFNTSFGQLLTGADAKGRTVKYNWAANNLDVLTVQQFTAGPATYTTIATYGNYNTLHEPQTYTDAAGKVWNLTYNTAGQITSITDPNTGLTTWNYDTLGRISNVVNANTATAVTYTYDSADRVATKTDSEGYTLTYGYDNLDRLTSITYPDGTTDLYDYSFQSGPNAGMQSLDLRKHTDRLGRVTTYDYDADRRLIAVTEPTTATTTRTTTYDYYENGTPKNITDANGNVTHWEIDIESRPISKTYAFGTPQAQTETYAYEATTSRLKSITDAQGQVKTFTHGLDDRVTAIAYTNTVNPTPNVAFTYETFFPRLSSMTDGTGTTHFTYTAIGTNGALKLASIDGPFANDVIGLTYDVLGRLSGRTITGGNETFGYDAISRLTSHVTPLGTFTTTYLGQTDQTASRALTGTAISTNWGYDTNVSDRRLISIANSGVTRSYALSYLDPVTSANNPYDIMSVTDTAASGHPFASQTHGYTYDTVDRLATATSTTPGNYSYGYDNLDNATSITDPGLGSITPTYNAFNQLATFPSRTYSYDNNGNTTSDGLLRSYKWDAENRLIEIDYIGTSNKTVFAYDGLGRRTVATETVGGTSTTARFLWCGSTICQVRNGSDVVQSRILPEGEYNAISTQKTVYMQDQLGSVRDVLDGTTGALISSIDYGPYGIQTQTNGSFTPLYQYAGLAYHPQSALYLSATRAYDPVAGRWINRDSLREFGGRNPYIYTNDNPLRGLDPWGLITAVITNKNGAGGHSGVFVSNGGSGSPMIYDPYGSYNPSNSAPITVNPLIRDSLYPPRGSDGTIWGGNLWDYYKFEMTDGPDVQVYIFDTTPEQEEQIAGQARELGEVGYWTGLNGCGSKTSAALNGIGPFKTLGTFTFPSSLGNALATIQGENRGGISGGHIRQPISSR